MPKKSSARPFRGSFLVAPPITFISLLLQSSLLLLLSNSSNPSTIVQVTPPAVQFATPIVQIAPPTVQFYP